MTSDQDLSFWAFLRVVLHNVRKPLNATIVGTSIIVSGIIAMCFGFAKMLNNPVLVVLILFGLIAVWCGLCKNFSYPERRHDC